MSALEVVTTMRYTNLRILYFTVLAVSDASMKFLYI